MFGQILQTKGKMFNKKQLQFVPFITNCISMKTKLLFFSTFLFFAFAVNAQQLIDKWAFNGH